MQRLLMILALCPLLLAEARQPNALFVSNDLVGCLGKHDIPYFPDYGIYRPHGPSIVPDVYFEPFPPDQITPSFPHPPPSSLRQGYGRQAGPANGCFRNLSPKANSWQPGGRCLGTTYPNLPAPNSLRG
ncbi:MAG: hypothetical protein CFE26_03980 [Verrucomicrobiales bacterium VVV1]|nr:MAG: hypothetical protein CFE26_03980 [Verrucomicrobiales bacterium VVV1]